MNIGDKLHFKKFYWELVKKKPTICGGAIYKYKVVRKYYKFINISYTKQTYEVLPWRWNFLKKELQKNPDYHYTMSLWSNCKRK